MGDRRAWEGGSMALWFSRIGAQLRGGTKKLCGAEGKGECNGLMLSGAEARLVEQIIKVREVMCGRRQQGPSAPPC